jgi:uncharacterized membrane protein YphA (DoxX/SURF4 family)
VPAVLLPAFAVAAILLVVAGASKIASPYMTQASLSTAGLPAPLAAVRVLALAEVAIGAAALIEPTTLTAAVAAVAYATFCLFTVRLLRMADEGVDCGCFGGAGSEVSRIHVALNATAFAICAAAAAWPPPGPGWVFGRAPLTAIAVSIGIAAAAYASFLAFTVFPRAWRSYSNGAAS